MTKNEIRALFPAIEQKVHGSPLVYLDNAATTLKPRSVIESLELFYRLQTANVHRGAHYLSDRATERFEETRDLVAKFLNAKGGDEIVFVRGTTEAINLVANGLAESLRAGDHILLTLMEHHSNIVPWQMLAKQKDLKVDFVNVLDNGELDLEDFEKKIKNVKVFAFTHCSNALGTVNPAKDLIRKAREAGVVTVVDAAQSVSQMKVDVQDLDCDFLAFSGHKLFGPFGVGALYGKTERLRSLPPFQGGGSMIHEVTTEGFTFLEPPHRFEAGTSAIAEVVALKPALELVQSVGFAEIQKHERGLLQLAENRLRDISEVKVVGTSPTKNNILSFTYEGAHPSDVGSILDQQGIAVRAGHHCCQPLMRRFSIPGTVRAAFSLYNNESDVERLFAGLKKVREILR